MSSSKVYEILRLVSICAPEDMLLRRDMLIAQIARLPEYTILREKREFRSLFEENFARGVLESFRYDVERLKKVFVAVEILPTVLSKLIRSIQFGCGPNMSSYDKPDFSDPNQLLELLDKIDSDTSGKNISNVEDSEFMLLFGNTVIKSAEDLFLALPLETKWDSPDALVKALPDVKFCVNRNEFEEVFKNANKMLLEFERDKKRQKEEKLGRLLLKIALVMIFLAIPMVLWMFNLLSQEWLIKSLVLNGVVSALYLGLG